MTITMALSSQESDYQVATVDGDKLAVADGIDVRDCWIAFSVDVAVALDLHLLSIFLPNCRVVLAVVGYRHCSRQTKANATQWQAWALHIGRHDFQRRNRGNAL